MAHLENVYNFSKVKLEPFGRIGIGVLGLISTILILILRTIWLGTLLTVRLMREEIMMINPTKTEINNNQKPLLDINIIVFSISVFTFINQHKNTPFIDAKL